MALSNALTDSKVRATKPALGDDGKAQTFTDGYGLYLLVQPQRIGGGKLWRYKYTFEGKARLMALGKYPAVTLVAAREKHLAARQLVASGVDPMAQKKAVKIAKKVAEESAFANVYKLWLAHWRQNKSPRHVDYTERRIAADVLPLLGARPINEITAMDIKAMAKKIDARGARDVAKRAIETTGQIFEYAMHDDLCSRNPARDFKIGNILSPASTRNRPRVSLEELPELLRAIDKYKGFITRLALKLSALTFVRPSNIRNAQWREFDLDNARWTILGEQMKAIYSSAFATPPHIVPLSRQAVEVLRALQQLTGDGKYLFPSDRKSNQPMSGATINAALERMGYSGRMCPHGWRGVASTALHEHQFPHEHIELQLAHTKRDSVSAAYDYAKHLEPRVKMMQWYADYLDRVKHGAKVIAIA
jgi:integrase